jgi:hypothetical protein
MSETERDKENLAIFRAGAFVWIMEALYLKAVRFVFAQNVEVFFDFVSFEHAAVASKTESCSLLIEYTMPTCRVICWARTLEYTECPEKNAKVMTFVPD